MTNQQEDTPPDNLPGMAYRCRNDEDRTMEFVGEGCLDLTGYNPADLILNRVVSYGQLIHRQDRRSLWSSIQAALREGRPFRHAYRIVAAGGQEKWVWEQGSGVFTSEGELLEVRGSITSIADWLSAYRNLEQRAAGRTRELSTLLEVSRNVTSTIINSNRPLNDILDQVVSQAGTLLGADAVVLYRRQGPDEALAVHASRGLPADPTEMPDFPLAPRVAGRGTWMRQPVTVVDLGAVLPDFGDSLESRPRLGGLCRALLAVPVVIQKEVYGGLELYYSAPWEFSGEEVRLALAFADQAALAIQNARLRVQVEQTAVAAERNRLARDLHDAVTQTLFSASLIAEVLPRLSERNPEEARRRLEELRQLTRGALAEMRALLLELRPAALTEVDLGDLLRPLAEAITGRARVPVALSVEGKRPLPPDVQVALYRIAQEALNNVARHAGASRASVDLRFHPSGVELSIADDGCGFDPKEVSAEHLGLEIMGERAESIGALLEIESRVGYGTRVATRWTECGGEEVEGQ